MRMTLSPCFTTSTWGPSGTGARTAPVADTIALCTCGVRRAAASWERLPVKNGFMVRGSRNRGSKIAGRKFQSVRAGTPGDVAFGLHGGRRIRAALGRERELGLGVGRRAGLDGKLLGRGHGLVLVLLFTVHEREAQRNALVGLARGRFV